MSNLIHHTSCDNCGSSDANGVYDDGHEWCFSCGYYKPSESLSINTMDKILTGNKSKKELDKLPEDLTSSIPPEPYVWLKQYAITNEEIVKHGLGWSRSREMLIFPYYNQSGDSHEIIMWQGRYFPTRKPKVYTSGNVAESLILLAPSDNSSIDDKCCVVVEDPVSAIKVGRQAACCPLFGSNLDLKKAQRISRYFSTLVLYLDQDKTKEMLKFKEMYQYLFDNIYIISTEDDPKLQEDSFIKQKIKELLD